MPTSASPTRDSLRAAAHADIERDLRMKVKHLECDMELMQGEVEERDSLLARAKQAIEALQGELYATRKEVDDLAEVGKEDQGMRSQLWINEVRTHTQPASASCSRKSINLMKAPLTCCLASIPADFLPRGSGIYDMHSLSLSLSPSPMCPSFPCHKKACNAQAAELDEARDSAHELERAVATSRCGHMCGINILKLKICTHQMDPLDG